MTFCCDWAAPPAKLNIAGAAALLSTGVKLNPPGVEALAAGALVAPKPGAPPALGAKANVLGPVFVCAPPKLKPPVPGAFGAPKLNPAAGATDPKAGGAAFADDPKRLVELLPPSASIVSSEPAGAELEDGPNMNDVAEAC